MTPCVRVSPWAAALFLLLLRWHGYCMILLVWISKKDVVDFSFSSYPNYLPRDCIMLYICNPLCRHTCKPEKYFSIVCPHVVNQPYPSHPRPPPSQRNNNKGMWCMHVHTTWLAILFLVLIYPWMYSWIPRSISDTISQAAWQILVERLKSQPAGCDMPILGKCRVGQSDYVRHQNIQASSKHDEYMGFEKKTTIDSDSIYSKRYASWIIDCFSSVSSVVFSNDDRRRDPSGVFDARILSERGRIVTFM